VSINVIYVVPCVLLLALHIYPEFAYEQAVLLDGALPMVIKTTFKRRLNYKTLIEQRNTETFYTSS
jgi:hypothetical protein